MSSEQELITWKTAAWKDRGMVAGYAQRMIDSSGAIMMKNRIEVSAYARYAQGKKILDVGVGTGRASLPLARAGFEVSGVDSSVAMLDKTRELAAGVPITLIEGDVAKLAFGDGTFDTVMALNTIAHFPHWQPILAEWQRVVTPGGRMIFDMFSLDHDIAFAVASGKGEEYGVNEFAPKDTASYYLRLKIEDVVHYATSAGMRVAAIQPYSVLIGSGGYNRFLEGGPLSGKAWDRLLTWIGADEKLFNFLAFIEEEFFGKLTSRVACRYVVVLDNARAEDANHGWLDHNAAVNAALSDGLDAKLLKTAGIDVGTFRKTLAAHMTHKPNRFALYRMLMANAAWNWKIDLAGILPAEFVAECEAVTERAKVDASVTHLLENLHRHPEMREALRHRGVPVVKGLEYDLMIALLDGPVGAFKSGLSERPTGEKK